jgi:hypothetical protein
VRFCSACGAELPSLTPTTCSKCGTGHWRNPKPCANAVVVDDGRVLIFDWEESFLTNPFFSVVQWMQRTGPCGDVARGAYLDALPWGTRPQRERALELAVLLCDIKNGHVGEVIRDAEGFPGVFSRGALRFIRRAHHTWSNAE